MPVTLHLTPAQLRILDECLQREGTTDVATWLMEKAREAAVVLLCGDLHPSAEEAAYALWDGKEVA